MCLSHRVEVPSKIPACPRSGGQKSGNGSEGVIGHGQVNGEVGCFGGCTLRGTPATKGVPHIGKPCHQKYLHVPDQADKSGNGSERVIEHGQASGEVGCFGGCTLGGTPAPKGVPHIG